MTPLIKIKQIFIIMLFWVIVCPVKILFAEEWKVCPSLEVGEEYNDNILLSESEERILEDLIIIVSPEIQISGSSGNTRFDITSILPGEKYIDNKEFDTFKNTTTAFLAQTWTSKAVTELTATFQKKNTLESDLETSGLATTEYGQDLIDEKYRFKKSDQYHYNLVATHSYQLSPVFLLGTSIDFLINHYPDEQYPELRELHTGINPALAINAQMETGLQP